MIQAIWDWLLSDSKTPNWAGVLIVIIVYAAFAFAFQALDYSTRRLREATNYWNRTAALLKNEYGEE